jgi:hypothetical protein
VFGAPLAADVDSTPLSERVSAAFSGASDTDTRDVFGRPLASDLDEATFPERVQDVADRARETSVYVSPIRPRQRLDVGRAEDQPSVDLGPFADDDVGDLPSFAEAYDVDVDTRRFDSSGGANQAQQTALRLRRDRDERDTTRAARDEGQGDRAAPVLPAAVPGVNTQATDPIRGALNRQGAALEPSVTPSGTVDRGTSLSDAADVGPQFRFDGGGRTNIDPRFEIGTRTNLRQEQRVDTGVSTRVDERFETRQEQRFETRVEFNTRFDVPGPELEEQRDQFDPVGAAGTAPQRFENAVETPGDFLGLGEFRGRGRDEEELEEIDATGGGVGGFGGGFQAFDGAEQGDDVEIDESGGLF